MRSILGRRLADFALACIVPVRCVLMGRGRVEVGRTYYDPLAHMYMSPAARSHLELVSSRYQSEQSSEQPSATGCALEAHILCCNQSTHTPRIPTTLHNQRLSCHIHRVGKELPARGPLWRGGAKRRSSRGRELALLQVLSFRTWIDTDIGISDW